MTVMGRAKRLARVVVIFEPDSLVALRMVDMERAIATPMPDHVTGLFTQELRVFRVLACQRVQFLVATV